MNSSDQAHTVRVAVYGILLKDDKVLMLRRHMTGWMDGTYGLPAGHLEKGETLDDALLREIYEEIAVRVKKEDIEFRHVSHRMEEGNFEYIDFYYFVRKWEGEPVIAEPTKADRLEWFPIDNLPENATPNAGWGIIASQGDKVLSEFGG